VTISYNFFSDLAIYIAALSAFRVSSSLAKRAAADPQRVFNSPLLYSDDGYQTSVALHTSGLALELHRSNRESRVYYRLGRLKSDNADNYRYVDWRARQRADFGDRYWPTVALSQEGYIILVGSGAEYRSGSQLSYRIGKIDPNAGPDQSIQWKTDIIFWDGGFHTSVAINDNGVIVGVHESNNISNNNLHYRVGHLRNPAFGDYTIEWDSGHAGIRYDSGRNPHIAINNQNQVVAVHQTPTGSFLHYRRGMVNFGLSPGGARIDFRGSQRYDSYGEQPAVLLKETE
jgi:hypothetical protein